MNRLRAASASKAGRSEPFGHQRAPEEFVQSVAHHGGRFGGAHWGDLVGGKRDVESGGDVGHGVHERAVEIEDDGRRDRCRWQPHADPLLEICGYGVGAAGPICGNIGSQDFESTAAGPTYRERGGSATRAHSIVITVKSSVTVARPATKAPAKTNPRLSRCPYTASARSNGQGRRRALADLRGAGRHTGRRP